MSIARNPFSSASPDPYYAMARPEQELLTVLRSAAGSQFLIQGPRRIGKTTLLRQSVPESLLIEASLYGAKSFEDCSQLVSAAVERVTGRALAAQSKVSGTGGVFGFGASKETSRRPSGDLLSRAFDLLIDWLRDANEPATLFVDEIQVVVESAETLRFAQRLRTEIQRSLHLINAVFAGSNSSMVADFHGMTNSPFYKQLHSIELANLPREEFFEWARARLVEFNGGGIDNQAFMDLCEFCRDVPGDIQRTLERCVYRMQPDSVLGEREILDAIQGISESVGQDMLQVVNGLTKNQLLLVIFVSMRDRLRLDITISGAKAQAIMSNMPGGTITNSLKSLVRQGIVSTWNNRLYIDNPFLEQAIVNAFPLDVEKMRKAIDASQ